MICPICAKKGLKSYVYVGTMTTTLMYSQPYYDEEGKYHFNDPNTRCTDYRCSNGHNWSVSEYQGKETIKIHEKPNLETVANK